MSKKTANNGALSPDLRDDMDKAADYSPAFTNRIATLSQKIEAKLGLPVEYKPDMNYSVAEIISTWFDKKCHPIPPRDDRAKWRLNTHISSKGAYFAFVVLKLSDSSENWQAMGLTQPRRYWAPVKEREIPSALKSSEKKIAFVLKGEGYKRLSETVLAKEVERRKTDSGEPATVFDLLFGESC
jgi:hypothetical protein